MTIKKWILRKQNNKLADILAEECGIEPFAANILVARGHVTADDAMKYLDCECELSSPFSLIDMDKAVERIHEAIESGEKIAIYGDYDCDGITSTAMLYTYLNSVGADVICRVPEREENGYGICNEAINELKEEAVQLIITVDNGISALTETMYAKSLGIDMVITDHHQPGDTLPEAVAVVDPHRKDCQSEFKQLAGVGVAFKLIAALEDGDYYTAVEYFCDIVAIGTIGDAMPIEGENRAIVKSGLNALCNTDNAGIISLMEVAGIKPEGITSQTVAFSIVPRINAAGRMNRADLALKLLITEDEEEAAKIAEELNNLNEQRKSAEQKLISDIEDAVAKNPAVLNGRLIIAKGSNWSHGVLGIACSRLSERFGKPSLLMTEDENGVLTGSARSIGEFHMFKALASCSGALLRFGGHKNAAGFSLKTENYDEFVRLIELYARKVNDIMPPPLLMLDADVTADMLTPQNLIALKAMEPYGRENDEPIFLLKNSVLTKITPLSGGKHQRVTLKSGNSSIQGLLFNVDSRSFLLREGETVDVAAVADIDEYNGAKSVILKINEIRKSQFKQDAYFNAKAYYGKLKRGEEISKPILERSIPTREDAAHVYRLLNTMSGYNGNIDNLFFAVSSDSINYCKFRIILDIMSELSLIKVSPLLNNIEMLPVSAKVDFTGAKEYKRLESLLGR